jgi:hypothetical protein
MAETGERALLDILCQHLEITQKLLEHYIKLAHAVQLRPDMAALLPLLPKHPTLQELLSSTSALLELVRSTLDLK